MVKCDEMPGLATPWPDRHKFANTRRLLAAWRWEWERGPDSDAARNAYKSIQEHTAPLTAELGEEAIHD